jgi:hypothetical protein
VPERSDACDVRHRRARRRRGGRGATSSSPSRHGASGS